MKAKESLKACCAAFLLLSGAATTTAATIDTLYNTGVSETGALLAEGEVDPHYTLLFSPDPVAFGPDAFTLLPGFPVGPWLAEGPDSRWIAPQADQSLGNAVGVYTFSTSFDLTGVDPNTAEITGQMSADNNVTAVRVNGLDVGITSGGFNAWFPFTIPAGNGYFFEGLNTIEFDVSNAGDTANPIGLRVEMTGTATGMDEAPAIVTHPEPMEIIEGQPLVLTVDARGTPPLSFQWLRDGDPISGATEPTYTIQDSSADASGAYSVTIQNAFGEITSEVADVSVLVPFPGIYNTGVNDDHEVLFDSEQDPHYTLVANPNDESSSATFVQYSDIFPLGENPAWLPNSEESKWIGPAIDTGAAVGGEYRYQLELDLTGYDPSTAYLAGSWASDNEGSLYLNGADTGFRTSGFGGLSDFVLEGGFISGVNLLEFRVNNAGEGHTGLRVENLRGTAEEGSGGQTAPSIVTHPQSATRVVTQSYTFTAVTDGTPPFTYQWFRDGEPIEGATESSLTISSIEAASGGAYTVEVTNEFGADTSDPAELTVIQPEIGVYNTGVDSTGALLPLGEPDPHYLLISSGDPAFPPFTAYAAAGAPIPPWVANSETSLWISPRPDGVDAAPGTYTYRLIFEIPNEDEVASAALTASVTTDDGNGGIFLNGEQVEFGDTAFGNFTELSIPQGAPFVHGLNTLDFVVSNGGAAANPTGLRVENIQLTGVTQPEPAPELAVSEADGSVRVSWPASASGFTLQESAAVDGGWTDSSAAVTVEGGQNVALIPIEGEARFFRLIQ